MSTGKCECGVVNCQFPDCHKLGKCSICHGPLFIGNPRWQGGNNARPINDGRCCDLCNAIVVLPARIARLQHTKD